MELSRASQENKSHFPLEVPQGTDRKLLGKLSFYPQSAFFRAFNQDLTHKKNSSLTPLNLGNVCVPYVPLKSSNTNMKGSEKSCRKETYFDVVQSSFS